MRKRWFAAALVGACALASGTRASGTRAAERPDPLLAAIDERLQAYDAMAAFQGVVLIAEGDRVVYHKSFGMADYENAVPMSIDRVFSIASISKPVTKALLLRLADTGVLTLDDPLAKFLPGYPNAEKITLRMLASHRAGVPHTNRLDWVDMTKPISLEEIVAGLAKETPDFEPDEKSSYSNGGYALLAKIIEIASGVSYEAFLNAEFAARYPTLGHEEAWEVVPHQALKYAPGPVPGERSKATTYLVANRPGGGSLHASAHDLYRFFRDGIDGELLSANMTEEAFGLPADGPASLQGISPGTLAQVTLDARDDLIVVVLSSSSGWPSQISSDIARMHRGETAPLEPFERGPLTPALIDRYAGTFDSQNFEMRMTISASGDHFVAALRDGFTAFVPTTKGELHLPLYDWLCGPGESEIAITCRQRGNPVDGPRFTFKRAGE